MKYALFVLSLMVTSAFGQNDPPIGIKPVMVQMQLFCADSFEFLMNVLAADFDEHPVMMGYLKEGPESAHTLVYFTNKENTQSTLVITKTSKDREQSCIMWSGESPSGMAYSARPPQHGDET